MILALAGGVGGAGLASGLALALAPGELAVAVNVGDDFEHLGLSISPDLDTVMYTLAGMENPETGWGRAGETWHFMETLARLGGGIWFGPGERDPAVPAVCADVARHGQSAGCRRGCETACEPRPAHTACQREDHRNRSSFLCLSSSRPEPSRRP